MTATSTRQQRRRHGDEVSFAPKVLLPLRPASGPVPRSMTIIVPSNGPRNAVIVGDYDGIGFAAEIL